MSTLFPSEIPPVGGLPPAERKRLVSDHYHLFRQVAIILNGEEYLVLRDRVYRCGPMTVAYIDFSEPHGFCHTDSLHVSTSFRVDLRQGHVLTRVLRREAGGEEIFDEHDVLLSGTRGRPLDEHWSIIRDLNEPVTAVKRSKLVLATASLLAELLDDTARVRDAQGLSHEDLLSDITLFIEESLGDRPRADALASIAGYSRSHFLRLFKRLTGRTVRQYIDEGRFARAQVLREHGMNWKSIAELLGYSSPSAFHRWHAKQRRKEQR